MTTDEVWKLPNIVNRFLSYRAAIPLAQEQIGVMMSILKTREEPIESFLDLGRIQTLFYRVHPFLLLQLKLACPLPNILK